MRRISRLQDYLNDRQRIQFPDPKTASSWGPAAQGGNLSPGVLLSAYEQGFFPWYETPPILWHSPDPRFVLGVPRFHIPRRFKRTLHKSLASGAVQITFDSAFSDVIQSCSTVGDRDWATWITDDVLRGYTEMHTLGYAHSIEVWEGERLIGGLYGLAVGGLFSGESMFSIEPGASKFALVALVAVLHYLELPLLDCQTYTDYLASFGAENIPREDFLRSLKDLRDRRGAIPQDWQGFDPITTINQLMSSSVVKPAPPDKLAED